MLARTYLKITTILTLSGVLFSGYLSAEKLFTRQCAFNEPCPYFLGHPACFYGFGLFLILFIASLLGLFRFLKDELTKNIVLAVSLAGVLFAGQWAVPEIKSLVFSTQAAQYQLGLPTCIYGFFFFLIIFILSLFPFRGESLL